MRHRVPPTNKVLSLKKTHTKLFVYLYTHHTNLIKIPPVQTSKL